MSRNFSEVSSRVVVWTSSQIDVGREVRCILPFGLFEAFRAFKVNYSLDNVQSLQKVAIKFYLIEIEEDSFLLTLIIRDFDLELITHLLVFIFELFNPCDQFGNILALHDFFDDLQASKES